MSEKKEHSGISTFIIVIVVIIGMIILALIGSFLFTKKDSSKHEEVKQKVTFSSKKIFSPFSSSRKELAPKHSGKYIAKLYIEGTIEDSNSSYNQKWLLDTIDDLKTDSDNVGIILFLNTPGGGVYEADEAYLALLDYKSTGKPLFAYMGPMAASGGYYIACAADSIIANRNTLTGSIGVIAGSSIDMTKLMSNIGITYTTIHAGKNKNMGNVNEPLTDEQREILQTVADECYDQFTSIVSSGRHMKKNDVVKLADGRIYTANQALANGLIDAIDNWDNTVTKMEDTKLDGEYCEVVDYKYEQARDFFSYLRGSADAIKKSAANAGSMIPAAVEKIITPKTPYPAYYYEAN